MIQQSLQILEPRFCQVCDTPLLLSNYNSYHIYSKRVSCSKRCSNIIGRTIRKNKPELVIRLCKLCNRNIERRPVESFFQYSHRKYCSRLCSTACKRARTGYRTVTNPIIYCKSCGKEIHKSLSAYGETYKKRKFCSAYCKRRFMVLGY